MAENDNVRAWRWVRHASVSLSLLCWLGTGGIDLNHWCVLLVRVPLIISAPWLPQSAGIKSPVRIVGVVTFSVSILIAR